MIFTDAQLQQLMPIIVGILIAFGAFLVWLFKTFIPRTMEARQKRIDAKATNEIERQRKLFDDELQKRQQLRQMEHDQQSALLNNMAMVMNAHEESVRNYVALAQKMLDQSITVAGELHGNKTVLSDVSATIDDLHKAFQDIQDKIAKITDDVQRSNINSLQAITTVNQALSCVESFGKKLDSFLDQVKQQAAQQ